MKHLLSLILTACFICISGCSQLVSEPYTELVDESHGRVVVKTTYLVKADGSRVRHGPETISIDAEGLRGTLVWKYGEPWEGLRIIDAGNRDVDYKYYRAGKLVSTGSRRKILRSARDCLASGW